jgi:hypothetical protein
MQGISGASSYSAVLLISGSLLAVLSTPGLGERRPGSLHVSIRLLRGDLDLPRPQVNAGRGHAQLLGDLLYRKAIPTAKQAGFPPFSGLRSHAVPFAVYEHMFGSVDATADGTDGRDDAPVEP